MNKIIGEKINLRKISKEDLALKVNWYNDPDINKTLFLEENLDLNKTIKWFEEHADDSTRYDFIIETKGLRSRGSSTPKNIFTSKS